MKSRNNIFKIQTNRLLNRAYLFGQLKIIIMVKRVKKIVPGVRNKMTNYKWITPLCWSAHVNSIGRCSPSLCALALNAFRCHKIFRAGLIVHTIQLKNANAKQIIRNAIPAPVSVPITTQ